MDARAHIDTRFLVLRLTPYSDSSLIVAGLSPDAGQLHFMLRGARRLGPRSFPVVDLFRVLQVSYRDRGGELHHFSRADRVADYGGVARHLTAYRTAAWLARFALANVLAGMPHEAFFAALCVGLERLAARALAGTEMEAAADGVVVGVCLTYLQEGGWLAEGGGDALATGQGAALLAMAAGAEPPRALAAEDWRALRAWVIGRARAAECHIPDLA